MQIFLKHIFFASLFMTCVSSIHAQVTVEKNGRIPSIQMAVDMASAYDTIRVMPGTYTESNIGINKPLTIEGIDRPMVDGNGEGYIFIIKADSVILRGFDIRNTGRSYVRDYAAIIIEGVSDFTIEDNRLDDVFFGIYLAETERGVVRNNRVEAYDSREASSGNGIHLWSVSNPRIIDNTVIGMRDGIYLEFVDQAEIHGNESNQNNRYGLHYMFSDGGRYSDNTFRRNGAGVAVMYSDNVNMFNNLFEHNWGTAAYGLLLKDINHSRIEGNRFIRNTVAIYSEGSNHVQIHRNHIEQNGWAINVKTNSMNNRFTENNFIENSFDVRTDSPRNNNVFEGNHWSGYEGYDLDGDGIGDVPYRPVRLFSMIMERQPESMILLRSTFIKLLDTAERVAPVLTPKTLFDEHPKMSRIQ